VLTITSAFCSSAAFMGNDMLGDPEREIALWNSPLEEGADSRANTEVPPED
jgi:hypothetical protein